MTEKLAAVKSQVLEANDKLELEITARKTIEGQLAKVGRRTSGRREVGREVGIACKGGWEV